MKICFVADARSPIAQNWIRYFIDHNYEVSVISSYPYSGDELSGVELHRINLGFSNLSNTNTRTAQNKKGNFVRSAITSARTGYLSKLILGLQSWLIPLDLYRHVGVLSSIITKINPDLVHAMRIPREGVAVSLAMPEHILLLLSVWGNDFTLFAPRNFIRRRQIRYALKRADALHSDCHRDKRLAFQWGFAADKPAIVLPGAGGLDRKTFTLAEPDPSTQLRYSIPKDAPVIINPRGIRGYVRNDVYFQAIPLVLQKHPDAVFVSLGVEGNDVVERWITRWQIPRKNVRLLPSVPHSEMSKLFQLASIAVSPSLHDGTPNTLLEAMACGAFPIAGRIESVEEWIIHGENGLLCDPTDPHALANAMTLVISDSTLRQAAAEKNQQIIDGRADSSRVMQQAAAFYDHILSLAGDTQ